MPKNLCFGIVWLEKTFENPLDCREIQPSILKEISPEYSLEGLMLMFQYFGYLMQRTDSVEKTLMLGKIEGRRRRRRQRMKWFDGITDWTGRPGVLQSLGSQRVRHDLETEQHHHHTVRTIDHTHGSAQMVSHS